MSVHEKVFARQVFEIKIPNTSREKRLAAVVVVGTDDAILARLCFSFSTKSICPLPVLLKKN